MFNYQIPVECLGNRESRVRGDASGNIELDDEEYADDLICINTSIIESKESLDIYDETFRRFGLTINYDKTETMCINFEEEIKVKETLFTVNSHEIKNVRQFKYLGQTFVNEQEKENIFLDLKIMSAECKFQEMKRVLCDRDIAIKTRSIFLTSFVRSRLCYAVQSWNLNETHIKKLEVKWHGFLRRMINGGFKRQAPIDDQHENFAYKYSNKDLQNISNTSSLRQFIIKQQLKYVAHICRLPNWDNRKKILFSKGKRGSRSIWKKFERLSGMSEEQIRKLMCNKTEFFEFIRTFKF